MNFKVSRFLKYTLIGILGWLMAISGAFCFLLPWSPLMQNGLLSFIREHPLLFSLAGFIILGIGIGFILRSKVQAKQKFVMLRIGNRSISMTPDVVEYYLNRYWKEKFPQLTVLNQLAVDQDIIKIESQIPFIPKNERPQLLKESQFELQDLFQSVLGYTQEVHLAIHFEE